MRHFASNCDSRCAPAEDDEEDDGIDDDLDEEDVCDCLDDDSCADGESGSASELGGMGLQPARCARKMAPLCLPLQAAREPLPA